MRHISFSTYENVLKSRFTTETALTHTNTHPHTLECIETSPQNRIVEREIMVIFLLPFGYIMLLRIESTGKKPPTLASVYINECISINLHISIAV